MFGLNRRKSVDQGFQDRSQELSDRLEILERRAQEAERAEKKRQEDAQRAENEQKQREAKAPPVPEGQSRSTETQTAPAPRPPPPCATRCLAKACTRKNVALRFRRIVLSHKAGSISRNGTSKKLPALHTSVSRVGSIAQARSMSAAAACG